MTKTVVILGGSYGGLGIAHKLLKSTLPSVSDLKVIMIAPSSHLYWIPATVRAIVPGQLKDEQVIGDFRKGFEKYPAGSYQFIQGTAIGLDASTKSVIFKTADGEKTQTYDQLVIATGTSYPGNVPWKPASSYEETLKLLHNTQQKVKNAKSIVVGGGGVTGVEAAGELGFEYGKTKEVKLISASNQILDGQVSASIAKGAQSTLENMGVKVVLNTRVVTVSPTADGKTELALSTGEKLTVDLYLPSTGVIPNSGFLPKSLLNEHGYVKVDSQLAVHGAKDIWAVGDVADADSNQIIFLDAEVKVLGANLDTVLRGNPATGEYKRAKPMIGLTLGRSKATGMAGSWKLPSIIIWAMKGRDMLTRKLPTFLDGTNY